MPVDGGGDRASLPGVIVLSNIDSPPRSVVSSRGAGNTLLQALARQGSSGENFVSDDCLPNRKNRDRNQAGNNQIKFCG